MLMKKLGLKFYSLASTQLCITEEQTANMAWPLAKGMGNILIR